MIECEYQRFQEVIYHNHSMKVMFISIMRCFQNSFCIVTVLSFALDNSSNLSGRKISTVIKYSTSGTDSINPDYEYQYQKALNKKISLVPEPDYSKTLSVISVMLSIVQMEESSNKLLLIETKQV